MIFTFILIILGVLTTTALITRRIFLFAACGLILFSNIAFLTLFKMNLHCDQYTSPYIAFFDFEQHPEETPTPLVYRPVIGTLIRLTYALILFLICFFPTILTLRHIKNFNTEKLKNPLLLLIPIGIVAAIIPDRIIGERLSTIIQVAGIFNLTLLIVIALFYSTGIRLKRLNSA